jgi:hypothetical protein
MHLFFANVYIILCVCTFLDKLLPNVFFPSKLVHVNLCVAHVAQSCMCVRIFGETCAQSFFWVKTFAFEFV